MKILQKYANGGNVATEKRDSAGGNTVYNFLDLSNDLKGKNGKNRVYNRGDGAGFSSNIVFLENKIEFERNSQFNEILSNLAMKSQGNALMSPSSGGLGKTNIVAVRTKTNPEGQIEIVSVITDVSLKDGAGGYMDGGYYSEITNPSVTGKPMEVFQFDVKTGDKEGMSERKGFNRVDLDRTFGRYGNYSPNVISNEMFQSLSNKLISLNQEQWYSDELKDDYSVQKLNYTNYFMPTSNENRDAVIERPFTTNSNVYSHVRNIRDEKGMEILMQYIMSQTFGQKGGPEYYRPRERTINGKSISSEKHYSLSGGMQGFNYVNTPAANFGDVPYDYRRAVDRMIGDIIAQAGFAGDLQGMIGEDGTWNREVLDNVFQVNNVDGVNYLTLNTGGYGGKGKNIVYNFPLDTDFGLVVKQALDNHIIKHSPYMTQSLKDANAGKGDNFKADGKNLSFNINAPSPVDGNSTIVRNLVKEFNTEAEANTIADNFNSRSLEDRMSSVVRDGFKYANIADVVADEDGTAVNVVDFSTGHIGAGDYNFYAPGRLKTFIPNNTLFTPFGVSIDKKRLNKEILIDKVEPNVVTPNNKFLPNLRIRQEIIDTKGTDVVNNEDVVETMGNWSNEEINALNQGGGIDGDGQQVTPPKGSNYIIQRGDTLTKIARDNNTTIEDIMSKNPFITDPNKIYAGDTLTLQTETKDGIPSYKSATKENPFGGIPAGTEQEHKQIYFDGQLQNWDSENKRWTTATETKKDKENLVESTLSQNNDKNIMLENLNQSGNEVVEEIESGAGSVSGATNFTGNIMKKFFENQKKKQEEKDSNEEENKELVSNEENKEEEEERKVPMATQKSAGVYVDEQGERIPQTQLHNYEIQEMKTGGVVKPIFAAEGSLLHQMTSNRGPMFAAGYSYTKKEKEEEEEETKEKKENTNDTDKKKEKKPRISIRQRIDEMLKRKARKQRTKKELKESGEWKNLSFAEKRLTLKEAKEKGDYKKGAIYKNPNVK